MYYNISSFLFTDAKYICFHLYFKIAGKRYRNKTK